MNVRARTWLAVTATLTLLAAPTAAAADTGDPHRRLSQSYASLSGSLIGFYADASGQSLQTYLDNEQLLLKPAELPDPVLADLGTRGTTDADAAGELGAVEGYDAFTTDDAAPDALPGAVPGAVEGYALDPDAAEFAALDVTELSAAGGMLLTADQAGQLGGDARGIKARDVRSLNAALAKAGVSINAKKYSNLAQLAKAVTRSARTPDGAVTLASASWVNQLSGLRSPKLKGPKAASASMPGIPADALPLGLLMNQSLANLVTDHPNLIKNAQRSGLGSAKLQQAWNTSMGKAYRDSGRSLTSLLPNPCVGEMMGVMATGKTRRSSGSCAPACTVGGKYLHYQAGAAFNPQQNSMVPNMDNPAGGVLNHATVKNMNKWAQQLLVTQNPQLVGPADSAQPGNAASDCASASASAKNTLGAKLPGMFANLK